MTGLLLALAAPSALTACAATSYADIPPMLGATDPELQQLTWRAQAGDEDAQFELGARYERGAGLPVDFGRAKALYQAAATSSGGVIHIYVAPIQAGGVGSLTPVDRGPRRVGLPRAAARFRELSDLSGAEAARPAVAALPEAAIPVARAIGDDQMATCAISLETAIRAIGRIVDGPVTAETVVAGVTSLGHERAEVERCLSFNQQVGQQSDRSFVNDQLAGMFDDDARRLRRTVIYDRTMLSSDHGNGIFFVDAVVWRAVVSDLARTGWREEVQRPDRSAASPGPAAPPPEPPVTQLFHNARLDCAMVVSMRRFGAPAEPGGEPVTWILTAVFLLSRD